MIYLQIKILYSERTCQSNLLLVTSSYNNYNTNFIYISENLQTNKGYIYRIYINTCPGTSLINRYKNK